MTLSLTYDDGLYLLSQVPNARGSETEEGLFQPQFSAVSPETSPTSSPRRPPRHLGGTDIYLRRAARAPPISPSLAARPAGVLAALHLCLAAVRASPDGARVIASRSNVIPTLLGLLSGGSVGE